MKRVIAQVALTIAAALTAAAPAVAQGVPVTMVDCMTGDPCIGTPGNDTINGSDRQDVIYGLGGDDVVDPGNDSVTDYVFCGPALMWSTKCQGSCLTTHKAFFSTAPGPT